MSDDQPSGGKQSDTDHFDIRWIDGGRKSQDAPHPAFRHGRQLDYSMPDQPHCEVELEHPAKRCGHYDLRCRRCGYRIGVTTAGLPDDPRSVRVPCNPIPAEEQAAP